MADQGDLGKCEAQEAKADNALLRFPEFRQ
jgi:hypothetical protein